MTAPSERIPGAGWSRAGAYSAAARSGVLAESCWTSGPLLAISSLVMADLPDGAGVGPQWHISFTKRGKRPRDIDLRRALRAFGMVGAEEDNHHPGNARHFWMPVDAAHRVDCECKDEEVNVVESDGYRWTNPAEGKCRGCELQRLLGKACPIHARVGAPEST